MLCEYQLVPSLPLEWSSGASPSSNQTVTSDPLPPKTSYFWFRVWFRVSETLSLDLLVSMAKTIEEGMSFLSRFRPDWSGDHQ